MAVGSFQRPSRQGARQNDTSFLKKTFDAMSQRPLVGATPAAAGEPGAPSAGTAPELEDLNRKRRTGRRCARAAARRTAPRGPRTCLHQRFSHNSGTARRLPAPGGCGGGPMGPFGRGSSPSLPRDDPSTNAAVAKTSNKPATVFESAARQNVQHYEIGVLGELDVLQHIAGKKRAEEFVGGPPTGRALPGERFHGVDGAKEPQPEQARLSVPLGGLRAFRGPRRVGSSRWKVSTCLKRFKYERGCPARA